MSDAQALPRIAVIGTGGTISSVGRHRRDLVDYVANDRIYDVFELLAEVPEVHEVADVVGVPFRAIPSTAMGPPECLELNECIHTLVADDAGLDGIVVTHGTASLEETAYFLNLVAKVRVPVVLVGAQRPASGISTDAHINLLNAVRVAGDRGARGMGVLVVQGSRAGSGRVAAMTGLRVAHAGATADNLTPPKARVLLMLGLTRSRDPAELQRFFDTY